MNLQNEKVIKFHSRALADHLAKEAGKHLKNQIALTDTEKAEIILYGTRLLAEELWAAHKVFSSEAEKRTEG